MKFAGVVSVSPTRFAAVNTGEVETALAGIAGLGFDGVELAVRDPRSVDLPRLKELLRCFGLRVPAIGTGQAFVDEGLSFDAAEPELRRRAFVRISEQLQLGAELEAKVIIGLIRGGGDRPESREMFTEALVRLDEEASRLGVVICVEPVNRYESRLLNTTAETSALITAGGCRSVRLLYDTFHANIEEADPAAALAESLPLLGHLHFADRNRRFPGAGHFDFGRVARVLVNGGYRGWISFEMLPLPSAEAAERAALDYTGAIFRAAVRTAGSGGDGRTEIL